MTDRLRALRDGTGPATWLAYFAAFSGLMVLFGIGPPALVGIIAGAGATSRVEFNKLEARLDALERDRPPNPP